MIKYVTLIYVVGKELNHIHDAEIIDKIIQVFINLHGIINSVIILKYLLDFNIT